MKKILITICLLALIAIILAGTVFEAKIKETHPSFDGPTFIISMMIFTIGTAYGVLERNWFIIVFTVAAMIAVPFVKGWFVEFWPYARHLIFSGF